MLLALMSQRLMPPPLTCLDNGGLFKLLVLYIYFCTSVGRVVVIQCCVAGHDNGSISRLPNCRRDLWCCIILAPLICHHTSPSKIFVVCLFVCLFPHFVRGIKQVGRRVGGACKAAKVCYVPFCEL